MDDHLPHRKMGEVELADALIRLLDMAGRYGWNYSPSVRRHYMIDKMSTVGGMHLSCNITLCDIGASLYASMPVTENIWISMTYSNAVNTILQVANRQEYDMEGAMIEKLKYNKQRQDHKRENRAQQHGKKF